MEKISFDAALHLPTIDPAPARPLAGRGNAPDRFDDHLQRASSSPRENDTRNRPSSDTKHAAGKPSDAPPQTATASDTGSPDDDSQREDASCDANGNELSTAVNSTESTTKVEAAQSDDKPSQDVTGGGDAAATAAGTAALATQSAAPQVVTQPAATSDAVALPERIAALDDSGDQSNGVPAKMPETGADAGLSTVDTPDITVRQVSETVDVKSHTLHAVATTQTKGSLPQPKPESAAVSTTTGSAGTSKPAEESVAPIEAEADSGDKKRHVGKARLTASDDAKLDATAASEAKAALPATTINDSNGGLQNNIAPDNALPSTDVPANNSQPANTGVNATSHVTDTAGKQTSTAQAPASAAPSAAQKVLEGSSRATASGGDNTSEVERARFVQRVSKAFQTASQRGEPLRLRLSPPELGSVRMEVSIRAGAMTAKLQAETPAAQSMLLDNLPALRERLAQHNIKIERFDVDLFGQTNEGSQQSPSDAFDRQASRALPPTMARPKGSAATEEKPAPMASRRGAGSGQLNVII